jgi:hypothetical protein
VTEGQTKILHASVVQTEKHFDATSLSRAKLWASRRRIAYNPLTDEVRMLDRCAVLITSSYVMRVARRRLKIRCRVVSANHKASIVTTTARLGKQYLQFTGYKERSASIE